MIIRVARSMKLTLKIFEAKGKDRDARRLHSMTMMSLSRAMNWMLNGPLICKLLGDLGLAMRRLTRRVVSM